MLAHLIVAFYHQWHGRWHLPGAGWLLRTASRALPRLQAYPLPIVGVGTVPIDFRDQAAFTWLQHQLGQPLAAWDTEDGLCQALVRCLPDQGVLWDVGANLGVVSSAILRGCPTVRVFAVEPNPAVCASLMTLFRAQQRVMVLGLALSDRCQDTILTIPKGKSVGASIEGLDYVLSTSQLTPAEVEQVPVRAVTGDALIAQGVVPVPQVIKIDAEGHELAVLRGLTQTLRQHRPIVFVEHLYLSDADVAHLVPEGYTIRSVRNTDGSFTEAFDRTAGHNSVLLPS